MRLLLLGACGQLGQALTLAISCSLPGWALITPRRHQCNLDDSIELLEWINRERPDVIINAAAYTSVEQAELHNDLAYRVNTHAVAILADAAKQVGALLVHFSTDYVFDGKGHRPWREDDSPSPINVYGVSKWKGEQAILVSGCHFLIFRTSWLHSPYRHNFVKTMLHLGKKGDPLTIVHDQFGAPTSATMLAEMVLVAIEQTLANPVMCGLYHIAAKGETCWYDYARFIFLEARNIGAEYECELGAIASNSYSTLVKRPLNSRLDTTKFSTTFGLVLPCWKDGVVETLRHLLIDNK